MAGHWVVQMAGSKAVQMADCWAGRSVVLLVDSTAGLTVELRADPLAA